jgi:hypothetical protein
LSGLCRLRGEAGRTVLRAPKLAPASPALVGGNGWGCRSGSVGRDVLGGAGGLALRRPVSYPDLTAGAARLPARRFVVVSRPPRASIIDKRRSGEIVSFMNIEAQPSQEHSMGGPSPRRSVVDVPQAPINLGVDGVRSRGHPSARRTTGASFCAARLAPPCEIGSVVKAPSMAAAGPRVARVAPGWPVCPASTS